VAEINIGELYVIRLTGLIGLILGNYTQFYLLIVSKTLKLRKINLINRINRLILSRLIESINSIN